MAKKPVTIDEVLHPLGVGASAIAMGYLEKDLFQRFHSLILPNVPPIKVYKRGEDYVLLIRIPSERNLKALKPVFYDVVIEFYPKNKDDRSSLYITEYGVRIFSNSPSYVFTFTYVYEDRGMLPSFIPKKYYNEESLKKAPTTRNPIELLGVEKSIWYAIHYLQKNQLLQKTRLDSIILHQKTTSRDVLNEIATHAEKLEERKGQKLKRKPKKTVSGSGGTVDNDPVGGTKTDNVLTSPQNLATLKTSQLKTPIERKDHKQPMKTEMSKASLKTSGVKTSFKTNPLKKK